MSGLKGKVVIVTGASTGIGAGIAAHLASLGCRLVLAARNLDNLRKVAENCKQNGLSEDKILLVQADLTKENDAKNIINKTIETFGQIDVLVNNAGTVTVLAKVHETKLEDYDYIMNLNARSVFHMTQLVTPHLMKTKGNIINISSVSSTRAVNHVAPYAMSKAAVDHLTRISASELAPHQIRVNAINPGAILTDIHQNMMPGITNDEIEKSYVNSHPIGRVGRADEIAKVVAFLASDDSSFVTGVCMPVDGGFLVNGKMF